MQLKIIKRLLPHDFFLISTSKFNWIGIKTPIHENTKDGEDVSKGCRVRSDMILGTLKSLRESETDYLIEYNPVTLPDVILNFGEVTEMDELTYPLRRLKDGKEFCLPLEFWNGMTDFHKRLDKDEIILRNAVSNYLKDFLFPGSVVYDPACSTGAFLQQLSKDHKGIYTIGQDVSENMIHAARQRVDEVHHGDSLIPACGASAADVVICRHLNFDVVTTKIAERLFSSALDALKSGGVIIIVGHTPILIDSARMEKEKLTVLRRLGISRDLSAIFQMYAMKKW